MSSHTPTIMEMTRREIEYEIEQLQADNVNIREENTKLKELLKSLEWKKVSMSTIEFCPSCARFKNEGHTKDCAISKALETSQAKEKEGG